MYKMFLPYAPMTGYFCFLGDGVRIEFGLLYQLQMIDDECGAVGGI
jgi:hypothetical protein